MAFIIKQEEEEDLITPSEDHSKAGDVCRCAWAGSTGAGGGEGERAMALI